MSNPIFNRVMNNDGTTILDSEPMTINGTISKTLILLALVFMSGFYTWNLFFQGAIDKVQMLMGVGIIGSIIFCMMACFAKSTIKISAPLYAIAEGFMLGGISAQAESRISGIAINAVCGTFLALFATLVLYRTGIIKCTEKFMAVIMTATISICGVYLIALIGGFFGFHMPGLFSAGPLGIGISLVICIIAALNFIIDFHNIEICQQNFAPKEYEWFGAFGLLVTLAWLYVEIINLLMKLNSRN